MKRKLWLKSCFLISLGIGILGCGDESARQKTTLKLTIDNKVALNTNSSEKIERDYGVLLSKFESACNASRFIKASTQQKNFGNPKQMGSDVSQSNLTSQKGQVIEVTTRSEAAIGTIDLSPKLLVCTTLRDGTVSGCRTLEKKSVSNQQEQYLTNLLLFLEANYGMKEKASLAWDSESVSKSSDGKLSQSVNEITAVTRNKIVCTSTYVEK